MTFLETICLVSFKVRSVTLIGLDHFQYHPQLTAEVVSAKSPNNEKQTFFNWGYIIGLIFIAIEEYAKQGTKEEEAKNMNALKTGYNGSSSWLDQK